MDRLPERNSIEAGKILRHAWDDIDHYRNTAVSCKRLAKGSYATMLLIGVVTGIVTVLSLNRPDIYSAELLRYSIMGLSLIGSTIAAAVSYLHPVQSWQQLQAASLALESEIWKFRTRTGAYTIAGQAGEVSGPVPKISMD